MRWDSSLDKSIINSDSWELDPVSGKSKGDVDRYQLPPNRTSRMSFSGSERNHFFIKNKNGQYVDASGVSGLDSANDGRSFAICDLNHDGRPDFLLANSNNETLGVYRNHSESLTANNNFIAVRLVGGNRTTNSSTTVSARDATGARVTVLAGDRKLTRELRCGEGLAAQNSNTLLFGLDDASVVTSMHVIWPSGRQKKLTQIEAGTLVTIFEDAAESGNEQGFVITPYSEVEPSSFTNELPLFGLNQQAPPDSLAVYTAMATWCSACRNHFPDLEELNRAFANDVHIYGVPVDPTDDVEKLTLYREAYRPPYQMLTVSNLEQEHFVAIAQEKLRNLPVPYSLVVFHPESGNSVVVQVVKGIPSVSDIKRARSLVNRKYQASASGGDGE